MLNLRHTLLPAATITLSMLCTQAQAAMADTFYLDRLSIDKCVGNPTCATTQIYDNQFNGSFSGGTAPSTVNYTNGDTSAWGATSGSTFSENSGRLALGGSQTVVVTSSIHGNLRQVNKAQLQTPKTSDRNALGKGRDFSVTSVWDLAAPTVSGTRYGLRLNDNKKSNPPATANNDIFDISIVNRNGTVLIEALDLLADFTPAGDNVLNDVALDLLGGDQIALQLAWDTTNQMASALYAYGSGGVLGSWTSLGSWSGVLFSDDSFTRARVYASASPVPEPQTWLLLGLGLLVVGFSARRREATAIAN